MPDFDVILAGGGLSTGLIALKLRRANPALSIAVIEKGRRLGGNHTWSFHGSDITADDLAALQPMIRQSWTEQDVIFPALQRTLSTPYFTIVSDDFDTLMRERLGPGALSNQTVVEISSNAVVLSDGQQLRANCVIDGRGWRAELGRQLALAYQKFFGLEVELDRPHGLERPIIMDADVAQTDGYRFFYCLPLTPASLLIEDTYYSPSIDLNPAQASDEIHEYAHARGWSIARILREEAGQLPIVLSGAMPATDGDTNNPVVCGLAAGLFHPTTGYSLPDAMRLANMIAQHSNPTTDIIKPKVRDFSSRLWQQRKFYRLLNRLLFVAARGDEKRKIMERFYRFPQPLIERFYAARSTPIDKLRILSGKPPIPIVTAARAVSARSAARYVQNHVS